MQKPILILLFVALVAIVAGAVLVPQMLAEPEAPMVQWGLDDEVEGSEPEAEQAAEAESGTIERTEAEPLAATTNLADAGQRVAAILRGRVVDKFQQPVAGAKVWLEFGRANGRNRPGRGDRNRRIPDPVQTDSEGRFAFQGQAFRRLRVSLQVQHRTHAPGLFDKDLGDIGATALATGDDTAEVELGDLVLQTGGTVRGRVTDLAGNGVPNADVTLEPDFRNRLRWQRNLSDLVPKATTDASGYYNWANVAEGDYAVTAVARMHTEGRSDRFTVAEDKLVEVEDIQLGPGFELAGHVRDARGQPIADADVVLRAAPDADERPGRGGGRGRGGPRGRTRDSRLKTDEKGAFFAEHLPGVELELRVDAAGYLDYEQAGIDPRVTKVVDVTMDVGLSIKGIVQRADGSLVKNFAVRVTRLRDLPPPGQPDLTLEQMMAKMSDDSLGDDERRRLMERMRGMREQFDRGGRGGRGGGMLGGGGRGGRGSGLGEPQAHPDGTFIAEGLQEGIYEVQVQAEDFARYQSEEVAVRAQQSPPMLRVVVDPGVYCAGIVLDRFGDPIAGAEVELREEQPQTERAPQQSGERGGRNFARMAGDWIRRASGRTQQLEAKTDSEGLFFIRHALRGTYALSVSADGFADERTEAFALQADRSDLEVRLQPLGSIVGTVSGLAADELREARVGAVVMPEEGGRMPNMFGRGGRGGFRTVEVNPDGSYRIDDVTPGQYVVRSWIGSPQELMRELGPQFFDGSLQPDAVVRGGEEARLDLQITRPQVGRVVGSVTNNGVSATGFRVELRRQDDGAQDNGGPGGGRGPMGRMRNFGRTFTGTVGSDGTFEIKDVTAGAYTLRVRSSRRGGILHEEPVQVVSDAATERSFALRSASLEGTLLVEDGSDAEELRGMAALLLDQTTAPENLGEVMRQSGNLVTRLNGGAFRFEAVKPGSYLLVMRPQGRAQTSQVVVIGGDERIQVVVGKAQ